MNNIFNQDFLDFISCLNETSVQYILVGGYAVILHGYPRTTGDLDLWLKKDELNYEKLVRAFSLFGMSLFGMTKERFLQNDDTDVFTFGRPPVCIDIMTQVKGLDFDQVYEQAKDVDIAGGKIKLIHLNHLITAKKASGRPKDINDIEHLTK